jgi:PAS domain S-box-containing protein
MYAPLDRFSNISLDRMSPRGPIKAKIKGEVESALQQQFIERRIKQVELHYQHLFENADIGLFEIDEKGNYLTTNNKFATIFGDSSMNEFAQIRNISDLKYVDENRYLQFLELLDKGEEISQFEVQVYNYYGHKIWISQSIHPIYNHHGYIIGYEGTVEDITARKENETNMELALNKLQELSELKSHFVSMVSHEFRSGLSIILTSSDLLRIHQEKMNTEQQAKYHTKIYNTVKRLTAMLDDVLQFNKIDTGKLNFEPDYLELHPLLEEVTQDLESIDQNNHHIILTNNDIYRQVLADEGLLKQIFLNLVGNAIKYSPQGSIIEVNVTSTEEQILFMIKDQGIGIPKTEQENLFKPFYRCKNAQKIAGTGLGLAIVKQAIELHGGDIQVKSEANQGTTFIFTLPVFCHFPQRVG